VSAAVELVASAVETAVADDFGPVRDEWRALNASARAGTMFLSPDWLEPWWDVFGVAEHATRRLHIVSVREGRKLIGLLPLFSEEASVGGVRLRRLAFLGDGETGCDYLDVLAAPGREREVLDRALEAILRLDWDLCDLDGLWRESFTAISLAQRFPNQHAVHGVLRDGRVRFVCPHIPLQGTYAHYLEGLGRRENLRRREKWIFRQPGTFIECARTPAEAAKAVEHFLKLHRMRWDSDGGSDGLCDDRHEAFHRDAVARLATAGELRLYTLFCARHPVASVYGVVHGGKFNYYQSGYSPDWGCKSVGLVLLARTVSDAFAEGLAEFDFLRGSEGYKGEWARGERWTVQLRLWRGVRGRAARSAQAARVFVRETLKAAIPKRALEEARKARRLLRR
jgi:CelD/BcsL family acetyltransferase involved in cellulose biosynthesis